VRINNRMMVLTFLLMFSGFVGTTVAADMDKDLVALAELMSGSFSSEDQAKADSSYYDIRLEMKRIWPDDEGVVWLYVEQAVGSHLDRPYRQRLYRVYENDDDSFTSEVYTLGDEPLQYAGGYRDTSLLAKLTPDVVSLREGCDVVLTKLEDGSYKGGTIGKGCISKLHNATYATSVITITKDAITSWDRGFDSNDNHIWGAEKGGYIFKKVKDYSL